MTAIAYLSDVLQEAETIVRRAGELAAKAFRGSKKQWTKIGGSPLTDADLVVEQFLVSTFSARYPDHGFIGEELGEQSPHAEHVWIIDPIDGTGYFAGEIPLYSISVALRQGHELVLGVVYNPETQELFSAAVGAGSKLNGKPIHCSAAQDITEARVCVEIPNRHSGCDIIQYALEKLGKLLPCAERVRVFGVSALGLCYTAVGGFDAYLNLNGGSQIWDLAAGRVILEQAGGTYTRCKNHVIVAGPATLHDQLVELLELPV